MSKKNNRKKKRTAGDFFRYFIMIIAAGVFLLSAAQLVKIFLEYKAGTDEYDRIREYVQTTEKEPGDEEIKGKKEEQQETEQPVPPRIDWESLQSLNRDIIGWLQIEGTEIDYPIVQGTDNDYYLKHTFEGNQNIAGAIFMDHANDRNFQDYNTIIYGHNMKNGSMFGRLGKYFVKKESVPGKYIWICTPEANYRYEIFSSHIVDASGTVYTLFTESDETFAAYVEKMAKQTLIDYETAVSPEKRIITLSTCTGNEATRFVVQAVQEGEY